MKAKNRERPFIPQEHTALGKTSQYMT